MVLKMACPTKRKGSDNWYFRRRIPADVQRIIAKLPREKRPRGWYKTDIVISLGTADRNAAKAKCPQVAAEVERQIAALKEGPKPLTQKQISALSGVAYKWLSETFEDEPILSPEDLRHAAELNREAAKGKYGRGPLLVGEKERRRQSLEERLGKIADTLLSRKSIVTDEDSRLRLLEALARDLAKASEKLARNREGNYEPDAYAARFPKWEGRKAKKTSLKKLIDDWQTSALARGVRKSVVKAWHGAALRFADWLKHDDARKVVRADFFKFANYRSQAGVSAATINKSDLAALKVIFKWITELGYLIENPTEGKIRVEGRGRRKVRDKSYSAKEAAAILTASDAVKPSKREDPKTTAAKHWVPWLCAYSGSRVNEMIQIRKKDVRKEQGSWIIRLTPEAGNIKTGNYRDVPVHKHLIDRGFIDFVQDAEDGPLFCHPGPDGSIAGAAEGVYSRIRKFVRNIVSDPNVQPTHAWRYTFKTRGFAAHIPEHTLDAICGHASRNVGGRYIEVTLATRIDAMKKFPRYDLRKKDAAV